ncbi:MAG: reverse transcriptase domain-containing protein [Candidatus Competibacter sp.]
MSETPPTWEEIAQVGDIERWVVARLRQLGLLDETTDPAKLTGAALHQYKARREEERRVRKQLRQQGWTAFRQAHLVHLGADVFHHDTPDQDRYDLPDPETRREANALPALKDAQTLAKALDLSIPRLRWLAFHREVDSGSHYQYWTIPKRDGGARLISAPKPTLKKSQRWILRQIAEHLPVHGAAHGFLPGRSIFSNAAVHAGARTVVKLDIRHFYPTVTWRRVKGLFRKGGYGEQVATVLALLCTEAPRELLQLDGKHYHVASGPRALPQGAPTSPALSNTVCLRLGLPPVRPEPKAGIPLHPLRRRPDLFLARRRAAAAGPPAALCSHDSQGGRLHPPPGQNPDSAPGSPSNRHRPGGQRSASGQSGAGAARPDSTPARRPAQPPERQARQRGKPGATARLGGLSAHDRPGAGQAVSGATQTTGGAWHG